MRLKCWAAIHLVSHNCLTTSLFFRSVVRRVVDGLGTARRRVLEPSQNRPLVDSLLFVVDRCLQIT